MPEKNLEEVGSSETSMSEQSQHSDPSGPGSPFHPWLAFVLLVVIGLFSGLMMYLMSQYPVSDTAKMLQPAAVESGKVQPSSTQLVLSGQSGRKLSFDLSIGSGWARDEGIRYAASFYRVSEEAGTVWISPYHVVSGVTAVRDASLSKEATQEELIIDVPAFLSGKFVVRFDLLNAGATIKESIQAGEFVFADEQAALEVDPRLCNLRIDGDTGQSYDLRSGIDIRPEENLLLTCSVKGNEGESISARPSFDNYKRALSGIAEITQHQPSFPIIDFDTKLKDVSLPVSKASLPGAYDALFSFRDAQGIQVSNSIVVHYVIAGESANVTDAVLDKAAYAKGETAKLRLSYSGSADRFEFSRSGGTKNAMLSARVDLQSPSMGSCLSASVIESLDPDAYEADIDLPVSADCPAASVTIRLEGTDSSLLDLYSMDNNN